MVASIWLGGTGKYHSRPSAAFLALNTDWGRQLARAEWLYGRLDEAAAFRESGFGVLLDQARTLALPIA